MCVLTLGSVVSMLYQRAEAQALGSWHTLEMTITGREMAYNNNNSKQTCKQQQCIHHNKKTQSGNECSIMLTISRD